MPEETPSTFTDSVSLLPAVIVTGAPALGAKIVVPVTRPRVVEPVKIERSPIF